MKRLAALPIIALLALTGCSEPEEETNRFDFNGIKTVLHHNLTAEENALLDQNQTQVKVGSGSISIIPAVITESDGKNKNGSYTQSKHIRMVIDTSNLPYECVNNKYDSTNESADASTPLPDKHEQKECAPLLVVSAAPSQDTKYGEGIEAGGGEDTLPRGRSVIEFDAVHGDFIKAFIAAQDNWTHYNAVTGETLKNEVPSSARSLFPYTVPGTTADTLSSTPQYTSGASTLTIGKATVTPDKYDRSTLSIPITTTLQDEMCDFMLDDEKPCTEVTLTTQQTGSDINSTDEPLKLPATYTGTITVSSMAFDQATLHARHWNGTDWENTTTINLLTGEASQP